MGRDYEGDRLFWDSSEDWEKFWGPLGGALIKGWNAEAGQPGRPID
jgi:hypothetical protein